MLNLGNVCTYDQRIRKDEIRAIYYYRKGAEWNMPQAAILGYAVAHMNMACCLACGQDCRKSIPSSYAWATIASGASHKARTFLASNLADITKAQVASGEKHIRALRDEIAATPPPVHPFVNDGT